MATLRDHSPYAPHNPYWRSILSLCSYGVPGDDPQVRKLEQMADAWENREHVVRGHNRKPLSRAER